MTLISTSPDCAGVRCLATPGAAVAARRLLLAVITTLAIVSRLGLLGWPFVNDSGLYAFLGKTVATGGVMYRDFYETKLPGTGLLAAGFWLIFRAHWIGYVLAGLAMAMGAAIAVSRLVRCAAGAEPARAALLFAITLLNFDYLVYSGFQLETIEVFFTSLSAWVGLTSVASGRTRGVATAGVLAGIAAMAKPGGVGVAVALALVIPRGSRSRQLLALLGGLMLPVSITLFYTWRSGALLYLGSALGDIHRYTAGTPFRIDAAIKLLIAGLFFVWPFLLRGSKRRSVESLDSVGGYCDQEETAPKARQTLLLRFAFVWLVLEALAVVAQARLYPYHFLPVICPLAVLYGLMPNRRLIPIAIGLLPTAALSLTWQGCCLTGITDRLKPMPVSQYISSHTNARNAVFADQSGRLLLETDLRPGSRLGTFFYLVNDDSAPQKYMQVLLSDLADRKPVYLVLPDDWDRAAPGLADGEMLSQMPRRQAQMISAWADFRRFVHAQYELETVIDRLQILHRRRPQIGPIDR